MPARLRSVSVTGGPDFGIKVGQITVAKSGVLSIIGAACTALFDRWVFSTAGLISFVGWNLLIAVCYLLIAMTSGGGLDSSYERNAHDA